LNSTSSCTWTHRAMREIYTYLSTDNIAIASQHQVEAKLA
jgi:hypothetical protein